MTDNRGNNLLLAFLNFDYKNYDTSYNNVFISKLLTKEKIQQFFDKGFDINFQNKKTKNTLLIDMITMGNPRTGHKDYVNCRSHRMAYQ